ncbi:DinB family protein [Pleurocapsa sp. PCC 7319]|uniref:DinB family protein n=1 Tax=Pleurocapsa sp. PCC 7319 TaxID=118161 RepID=UPI000567C30A|nr:DinB family protein [Pleurocapsa sp. PCC 7319]
MSLLNNLQLMSRYNQWMNQKVYQTAQKLDHEKIKQDQGAFFGSILGTLNHIFVADVIWLRRFSQYPQQYKSLNHLPELTSYTALDQIVADDLEAWYQSRHELDLVIINWCQEISSVDLDHGLQYTDTKGQQYQKNFGQLIQHFFNHQTHHRGQVSTLINQQGVDLGVTDLLMIIPEQLDPHES